MESETKIAQTKIAGTKIADLLSMEKATRERGLRVVAIGGGTGLSTLLKGLKRFVLQPSEIALPDPRSPVIRALCAALPATDDAASPGPLRTALTLLHPLHTPNPTAPP